MRAFIYPSVTLAAALVCLVGRALSISMYSAVAHTHGEVLLLTLTAACQGLMLGVIIGCAIASIITPAASAWAMSLVLCSLTGTGLPMGLLALRFDDGADVTALGMINIVLGVIGLIATMICAALWIHSARVGRRSALA